MIQVVQRAFDILEFIAKEPDTPKTLSEIAGTLQLNSGTCANILKTMVDRSYIDRMENKKGYILGANAYNLGGEDKYKRKLIETAKGEMELLTENINENSEITILRNNLRIVLLRISAEHSLQVRAASERVAYDMASGRIMVAHLPDASLEKYIEKYGLPHANEWEEATTMKTLKKQIEKIKADGYATRITKDHIFGIAVPIYLNGKAVAGLGVYMPEIRYEKYNKKKIVKSIIESGKKISEKLLY